MTNDESPPRIDQWYLEVGSDRCFTVTDYDADEGAIEIQYLDGDFEELDIDEWDTMVLDEIDQPEDWAGTLEDMGYDDL